jgi:hypothetical protein
MASELGVKASERLDTFRRKFKNFEIGELGSSAERRLQAMRISGPPKEPYITHMRALCYPQKRPTDTRAALSGAGEAAECHLPVPLKEPCNH